MARQTTRPSDRAEVVNDSLSHPLRVRILGFLRHEPPRTQSEVGRALGLSNAAARYHLNVLEGAGLVAFAGTRPGPNGITERLYAFRPEGWAEVSDDPDRAARLDFMLDYTFASIAEIHRKALARIKADWSPPFLAGSLGAFATPEEAHALRKALGWLAEGFARDHQDPDRPGAVPMALTFAVLPSSPDDAQGWAGERIFEWDGKAGTAGADVLPGDREVGGPGASPPDPAPGPSSAPVTG